MRETDAARINGLAWERRAPNHGPKVGLKRLQMASRWLSKSKWRPGGVGDAVRGRQGRLQAQPREAFWEAKRRLDGSRNRIRTASACEELLGRALEQV